MTEDLPTSSFLRSTDNYFLTDPRSISYSVDEEDPWSSIAFAPVDDMEQPFTQSQIMDEELVSEGITASNVLVGVDLPEIFDTAYIRAGPIGDRVSVEALETIVSLGGLGPRIFEQITALTVPSGALYITRDEFNCAMALLGFAQKNMELSLLTVYQHRNELPVPSLPSIRYVSIKRTNPLLATSPKPKRQQTFDDDPWRISSSPPNINSSGGLAAAAYGPKSTGMKNNATNNTVAVVNDMSQGAENAVTTIRPTTTEAATSIPSRVVPVDIVTDKATTQALVKASTESYQWFLDLDQISVSIAEKEGFLFTHVNYWVQSMQRQTSVRRRYSDFYWFWETLLKRYPCRVIPNLPPKKISNKDKVFLEKRLQGLSRFINHIVRHPVLKKDEEVITFLTEQSDFAAWRRAKSPDMKEEFERVNPQTEELEAFIPKDLDAQIDHIKSRLPKTIAKYDALCGIMDNMICLKEAQAREMRQYEESLRELAETEHDCFVNNCKACKKIVQGYDSVGTYLEQGSQIMEAEAASSATGIFEKLKGHRDMCVSFLEMLERTAKLDVNQINALYRRISANTAKVNQNRGVPGLEVEVERLDTAIKADTEKMVHQQRRHIYIRYCVASELSYLHKQQAFVAILYQNFVNEQLRYARRSVDTWKALEALLCDMPIPEDFA